MGPPRCGKTMLVQTVCIKSECNYVVATPADMRLAFMKVILASFLHLGSINFGWYDIEMWCHANDKLT